MAESFVRAGRGLEDWAESDPQVIAIADGEYRISWSEWNARADALAASLADFGVVAGDVVALRMVTRWEWLVAYFAASKLGTRILGVNWRTSASELQFVLSDSSAKVIVFDDADPAAVVAAANEAGVPIVIPVGHADAPNGFERLLRRADPLPRRTASPAPLLLYTSGTTGRAKGVQTMTPPDERAAGRLAAYRRSVENAVPRSRDDVLLLTMPLHHAAGPSLVRSAVSLGNRIVVMRRFDAARALALIADEGVTYWSCVPTMIRRIAALGPSAFSRESLGSLRSLMVGGSPVSAEIKLWVAAQLGEGILHESYGSTETSVLTHLYPADVSARAESSGRPYVNVDIDIRDAEGNPLGREVVGEIWARTPVTITSYLNEPPLGRETLDDEGFFRTGDVGRLDAEGYLFITGRSKDMIISGGVNLYPAEIEAAIRQHPAVHDVAVIGVPDDEFGESVMAICELEDGVVVAPGDILEDSRGLLPSYKLPRSVQILEELPRNTMGKVLKTELRSPYWEGRSSSIV